MTRQTFDLEQLRAFVAVIDTGGFTAAARASGALQSTISMKIKRLEAEVGQPLLVRLGRGVAPTAAGQDLSAHARDMLRLNDQAWGSLSSNRLSGQVRLGVPDDYAAQLSDTIRAFRLQHPEVTLDLSCAFSVELMRQVQDGALDLAVVTRMPSVPGGEILRREPMQWVSAPDFRPDDAAPLPLSVYPKEVCVLRTSMTEALSAAGMPWRIAYTSMSLTGQTAMVGAGLAMTALTRSMMQQAAQAVGPASVSGLPALPEIEIALHRRPGRPTEAARLLGDMLKERFVAGGGV
ncbi:DNA-binding transcriptional regulator, LysR family [Tranquillimonas rosea]|uniref:DNA-binding transcriptional regulator, LysR family n=1 Tax=Tranquillimonas rosea TaxID=641238 RepID=A0A1H9SSB4_9RHOB|nr:LysR substrate-binding domain-containing protein [Tranquillimonas rosea]SER87764.1 DNA-binding transcriptional regulator, LysR family [Tranquillimonas rosea]